MKRIAYLIIVIFLGSTVGLNSTIAQSPSTDLVTSGNMIILGQDGLTIHSLDSTSMAVDLDIEKSIIISSKYKSESPATALAMDSNYLAIGYDNGEIHIFSNIDSNRGNDYWSLDNIVDLENSYPVSSLFFYDYSLYAVSSKSNEIFSASTSILQSSSTTWDVESSFLNEKFSGFSSFQILETQSSSLEFSFVDSESKVAGLGSIPSNNGGVIHSMFPASFKDPNGELLSISSISKIVDEKNQLNYFLANTNNGLKMFNEVQQYTTIVVDNSKNEDTVNRQPNSIIAAVESGQPVTSTWIDIANNGASGVPTFPLTTNFGEVPFFGGQIGLRLAGVKQYFTHEELNKNDIMWDIVNDGNGMISLSTPLPENIIFEIISFEDTSTDIVLDAKHFSWNYQSSIYAPIRSSQLSPLFGQTTLSLYEASRVTSESLITPVVVALDPSFLGVFGSEWLRNAPTINTEVSFFFGSVQPIQSVYDPTIYMQGKNMFWEVQGDWSQTWNGQISNLQNQYVEVELRLVGADCKINNIRCYRDLRSVNDWSVKAPDNINRFSSSPNYEWVTILSYWVPVSDFESGFVIPFDEHNIRSHKSTSISPAHDGTVYHEEGPNSVLDLTWWGATGAPDIITDYGLVKWEIVANGRLMQYESNPDNNVVSGEELTVEYFDNLQDKYRILIVPTTVKYHRCDDWAFFGWDDCDDRTWVHDEFPLRIDLIEDRLQWTAEYVEEKVNMMFPLPEDQVEVTVAEWGAIVSRSEYETMWDWLGRQVQMTLQTFDVIDYGIELEQTLGYDRVVMLTDDHHFATGTGGSTPRVGGWMSYSGISPCSTSTIAKLNNGAPYTFGSHRQNSEVIRLTGDTIVHELGHSYILSHDNSGFGGATFNNCGSPWNYETPGDSLGWVPYYPSSSVEFLDLNYNGFDTCEVEQHTEMKLDGKSFMRYASDGESYDNNYDICDYMFDSWITNTDYEYSFGSFNRDMGSSYMDDYLVYLIANIGNWIAEVIWDFILDVVNTVSSAVNWIVNKIMSGILSLVDAIAGRDATEYLSLNGVIGYNSVSEEITHAKGNLMFSDNDNVGDCDDCELSNSMYLLLNQIDNSNQVVNSAIVNLEDCGSSAMDDNYDCSAYLGDGANIYPLTVSTAYVEGAERWELLDSIGNIVLQGLIPQLEIDSFNIEADKEAYSRGESVELDWSQESFDGLNYDNIDFEVELTDPHGQTYLIGNTIGDDGYSIDTSLFKTGQYSVQVFGHHGTTSFNSNSVDFTVEGIEIVNDWISSDIAAVGETIYFSIDFGSADNNEKCELHYSDETQLNHINQLGSKFLYSLPIDSVSESQLYIANSCGKNLNLDLDLVSSHGYESDSAEISADNSNDEHSHGEDIHFHPISESEYEEVMGNQYGKFSDLDLDRMLDILEICYTLGGGEYYWNTGWLNNHHAIVKQDKSMLENLIPKMCEQIDSPFDLSDEVLDSQSNDKESWESGEISVLIERIIAESSDPQSDGQSDDTSETEESKDEENTPFVSAFWVLCTIISVALFIERKKETEEN